MASDRRNLLIQQLKHNRPLWVAVLGPNRPTPYTYNAATQTFIEDIQKALDNKLLVMGILLDLTEDCDVINHKLRLPKLELYGLT
jgi:hypothetical protein